MSKLISMEPPKTDVKEILDDALTWAEDMQCIMLVGISKEGNQILRTSTMNGMEKAFCISFMNAYLNAWFSLEEG